MITKYKRIAAVLVIAAILVLPMAFSVSYAKWTGGANSINAEVNVGSWWTAPSGGTGLVDSEGNVIGGVENSSGSTFIDFFVNLFSGKTINYTLKIDNPQQVAMFYDGKQISSKNLQSENGEWTITLPDDGSVEYLGGGVFSVSETGDYNFAMKGQAGLFGRNSYTLIITKA